MSEGKSEDVTVKIPKAMADAIKQQLYFKWFRDLDDFVVAAVREKMEDGFSKWALGDGEKPQPAS